MNITLDQALQKGIEAHKGGKIQEADKFYTAVLQSQPEHPHANHNMGVLAVDIGKVQEALPFFKIAVESNPSIAQFWLSYIDALIKLNEIVCAKDIFNQAKKKEVKGDDFDELERKINELGGSFREPGIKESETIEKSEKLSNVLDTLTVDQATKLAKKKLKNGFYKEAKSLYEDILARFPKNKKAINGIKIILNGSNVTVSKSQGPSSEQLQNLINLYSRGQQQQALDQASEMLKLFPLSSSLHNICGAAYAGLKKFDSAIDSYKQAIKIKPDFAEAYNNIGNAQKNKGEFDSAIESYRQAIKIKPDLAAAYSNIANAQKNKGELDSAIESYKKAIDIKPEYAEAYCNMGNVLQEKGDLDRSIENYKRAIKIMPDYFEAYSSMGTALKGKGDLDEAINSYKQAIKIKPDYPQPYCNMGILLKDIDNFAESASYFKQAIELLKDDPSLLENTQRMLLKTLYFLGNETYFSDYLEKLISLGQTDAVIGSFCCRAASRYGAIFKNSFCSEPMNYIFEKSLLDSCNFEDVFVKTAKKLINSGEITKKKQDLLSYGYQTAGNLFVTEDRSLQYVKGIIDSEVKKYRNNFKDSAEGLVTNWPSDYIIYGWLVKMKSGGAIRPHMHEHGWISGSIYINVPFKSNTDSGNLVLCIEDPQYTNDENGKSEKIINVNTGSLCLFPSSLLHYTIPFESTEERIVLAFDVIPK